MKIKKIFLVLMLLLFSTTIFACKQQPIEVNWTQSSIELKVGQEKNISEIFSVKNGKLSDVVFNSLNKTIVLVQNGKIVAVDSGRAMVEAKAGENYAYITVVVETTTPQFSPVSNVIFDKTTNTVSWDRAYKIVNLSPVYADSYIVNINDGVNQTSQEVSTTSYQFTQSGNYTVSVIAKANGYANSQQSQEISFKLLEKPQSVSFDKTTQILSWEGGNYSYVVTVNELQLPATTNKYIQLDLSQEGSYKITVHATLDGYTSAKTQELVVTKLSAPTISVENGVLKYNRLQQNLTSNYVISVTTSLGAETFTNDQTGSYAFPSFTGQFNVKVKAVGIENVLDSEYSQIITVTKLAKPLINFDLDTKTITSDTDDISLYIKNTVTNNVKKVYFEDFKYVFDEDTGIYEIYAVNENATDNQINSDASTSLNIKVLNAITNLRHEENNNTSTLYFDQVEGFEGYRVYVDGVIVDGDLTQNQIVLNLATDELFDAGEKQISVVGYDHSYSLNGANYFVISENAVSDVITVTRFENLTPEKVDNQISWKEISNVVYYEFELYKDGNLLNSGQEDTNVFSTENLRFGNYVFKVKAIGNQTTTLSSLQFGEISFSIKEALSAPKVTFDHETQSLIVEESQNADTYIIEYQANQLATLTDNLTYDISSLLTNSGVYEFSVYAINSENDAENGGNLYKSSKTDVQIEKLVALANISLSKNEVISIDTSLYSGKLSTKAYSVKINNQNVDNLQNYEFDGNDFNIEIQMLANTASNSPYYANSQISTFSLTRLEQVENVKFNNYVITWDLTENAQNYLCKVYNNDQVAFEVNVDTNVYDITKNSTHLAKLNGDDNWCVEVTALISDQQIESGKTGYLNSNPSTQLNVNKLEKPTLNQFVSLDEDDLGVKIDWNDTLNATGYIINYNSNDSSLTSSEYELNNLTEQSYTLKIYATNPEYLTSEPLVVTLIRLESVDLISVSKDEKISFEYNNNAKHIKINQTEQVLPYDISSVTTIQQTFTIKLAGNTVDNTYYMTSNQTEFNFRRFEAMSAPVLTGETFTFDVITGCDYYELYFENSSSNLLINVDAGQNVNSINIKDYASLAEFLKQSGDYTVQIRACMNSYNLVSGQNFGWLSGEFSQKLDFYKLEEVKNIQILAEDTIEQKTVQISWDTVNGAESYIVYANNKVFANTTQTMIETDKLTYNNEYTQNGTYNIYVIAQANGKLTSEKSEVVTVNRLNSFKQSDLTVSNRAVLSWVSMAETTNFASYVSFTELTTTAVKLQVQNYDYSAQVFATDYSGYINFYVCPIGNRTTLLSGDYQYVSVLKLDKPNITLNGDHLIIAESELNKNASFEVVVNFVDSQNVTTVIDSFTVNANQEYYYKESWNNNNAINDENGKFVFIAKSISQNCIDSNNQTKEITKAKKVTFNGFIRESENSDKINLVATINQQLNGATYYLQVISKGTGTTVSNVSANQDNKLIYPLNEEMQYWLGKGDFELKLQVKANGYIDSDKVSLTGFKLNKITTFAVQEGKLTWNRTQDSQCSNYLLRVSNSTDTYYHRLDCEVLSSSLEGYVDSLVTNIKCLGNITHDSYTLENIILDSDYVSTASNDVTNLTVLKLQKPTQISVQSGNFKINTNANTEFVKASVNDSIYRLNGFIGEDFSFFGSCDEMYTGGKKLNPETLYNISFQLGSSAENIIYSDFSDEIKIKILANPITSTNDIQFTWSEDNVEKYTVSWPHSNTYHNYSVFLLSSTVQINYGNRSENYISLDCDTFGAGNCGVQVKVIGGSSLEPEGFYYLSSGYSQRKEFTKLDVTKVYVNDGVVEWDPVIDADGYYVYYYVADQDETLIKKEFITNSTLYSTKLTTNRWVMPENLSSLVQNNLYLIGVRAVSSNFEYYAPSTVFGFGTEIINEDETTDFIFEPVTKLKAPDNLVLQDGTLIWNTGNYDYTITIQNSIFSLDLKGGQSPFVYGTDLDKFRQSQVVLRFVDKGGNAKHFTVSPLKLFKAEITKQTMFEYICQEFDLPFNYEFGWPVLGWAADEIGDISAGEYSFSVMQNGDDDRWINSIYNTASNVYIPHATKARLSNFVLSWDEVNLNSSHSLNNSAKYSVAIEDIYGQRTVVHQTNNLSVDLRDLVNTDKILAGEYLVYVFVNGDSDYYLNGLVSNKIYIKVLPAVVAGIAEGILMWDSVSQTHTYKVTSVASNPNYNYDFETKVTTWSMGELQCYDNVGERLSYNITIQCIGDGITTISGKLADAGTIIKLETPQMKVEKGSFVWENVTGNEGYVVMINQPAEEKFIYAYRGKDTTTFESTYTGFNQYNIYARGTTASNLNKESISYAVSNTMTTDIDGVMIERVEQVRVHEGKLYWTDSKDWNDKNVTGYKLSFDDIQYYEPVYYESYQTVYLEGVRYVVFDVDEKFIAGDYKVYVQAYTTDTYYYSQQDKTYQQLLSPITQSSTIEFSKLRQVSNVRTLNGVVYWTSNDAKSNYYSLVFSKESESYEFTTYGTSWDVSILSLEELEIYKNITTDSSYNLKIRALGDSSTLINSDYCDEVVYNKLETISSVSYIQGDNEGFIIKLIFEGQVLGITYYEYAIKYDNGSGAKMIRSDSSNLIRKGYDAENDYYYAEIDGSALLGQSSLSLMYQVCVIPVSQSNILISDYSPTRTVYPPQSLDGQFQYNQEKRSISWIYNSAGSDVMFRIVDEVVTLNEDNEITVVSSQIYLSQSTEFVIEQTGLHRISICVVLTGESVASSYVYFNYEVGMEGLIKDEKFKVNLALGPMPFTLINFNLFESGNGASDTPYLITNSSQFNNINQRLDKPSYLGGESRWYFTINNDLELEDVRVTGNFGGVFDGGNYTITHTVNNASSSRVGLFSLIMSDGEIKNLKLNSTINQQNYSSVSELYISPFVIENNGSLNNLTLQSFTYTSVLEKSINIYFGGITAFNYGKIERCINNADIKFDGLLNQSGVRNSNISLGGIAYTNGKQGALVSIVESGNNSNISVYARSVVIGGLVAIHNNGALIQNTYSKGSIDVLITLSGSNINYVGGLVATSQETIRSSYSTAEIKVDLNNLVRTLHLGGLVGYISNVNGAVISNCYVGTANIVCVNNNYATANVGALVGYSNAQDTLSQICSFYLSTSLPAIINAPNGFNYQSFTNYTSLLNLLNSQDYAFKANGTNPPKLIWEA